MNKANAATAIQKSLTSLAEAIVVFKVVKSKVLNNEPTIKIPIKNPKSPILFIMKAFLAASLKSWFLYQNPINK